jgi:hypothetical protein
VFINRNGGNYEGAYADMTLGRPLYSLRTTWAWQLQFTFLQDIARAFQGGDLATVPIGTAMEMVPFVYNRRVITGVLNFTRSWGVINKANLTAGFRVSSARYDIPSTFPTDIDAAGRAQFQAMLPRSEDWAGPYVNLTAYKAKYIRLQNINTFALSEDFRLGPTFSLEAQAASPLFGLPSQFGTFTATYGHLWYAGGDLFSMGASGSVRLQAGVWPGSPAVNEDLQLSVRNVSPKFGPFRLHVFGSLHFRGHDLANLRLTIGNDSGLRAFAPREFQGNERYEVNVELRTTAINLWTLHGGLVIFYDGGDAPKNLVTASWHHGAGFGLRILFPQFNHDVLRLDLAFPFEIPAGGYVPRFSVAFGQAF